MKIYSCSTQLSMKYFLLKNVKMSTIVDIFTFMSRKKTAFWAYMILKNAEFLDLIIFFINYEHSEFHAQFS